MLTIGIDDAGRGPIIGPMILAGVLITPEQEKIIKEAGATDSKLLSQKSRERIAKIIKDNSISYKVIKVYPNEIDETLEKKGTNLNTLEAQKSADIINNLNKGKEKVKVIVDCPSSNTFAWKKTLLDFTKSPSNLNLKVEHKADLNHTSAAAASILAKVTREEEVEKIKKKYGDLGSGYPSDPATKIFLKNKGKAFENSGIFRKSWKTWKNLYPDKKQSSLRDY